MWQEKRVDSIEALLRETRDDYTKWGLGRRPWFPWFRGEPESENPLLPRLFRKKSLGDYYENRLLQHFRMRAMAYGKTPQRDQTDRWLFLAQHVGLPTRLLDWTEGSLIALYFALREKVPVVWMLNPFALNRLALGHDQTGREYNIYGLTWHAPADKTNIASANINAAWRDDEGGIDLPVAISPTYIQARIPAQRSCFTVYGKKREGLATLLLGTDILRKYVIDSSRAEEMLDELRILGVSEAALFPDLGGLSRDLTALFRPDLMAE